MESGLADGLLLESCVGLTQSTHPARSTTVATDVGGNEARLTTDILIFKRSRFSCRHALVFLLPACTRRLNVARMTAPRRREFVQADDYWATSQASHDELPQPDQLRQLLLIVRDARLTLAEVPLADLSFAFWVVPGCDAQCTGNLLALHGEA